jgi:hypothetical protein
MSLSLRRARGINGVAKPRASLSAEDRDCAYVKIEPDESKDSMNTIVEMGLHGLHS